jgi:hypothetical protein
VRDRKEKVLVPRIEEELTMGEVWKRCAKFATSSRKVVEVNGGGAAKTSKTSPRAVLKYQQDITALKGRMEEVEVMLDRKETLITQMGRMLAHHRSRHLGKLSRFCQPQ